MARKKNGNGKPAPDRPTDPGIAFLAMKIDANADVMARGFADVVIGLEKVTVGLEKVTVGLSNVNSRLDQVIVNTGGHWRDLDARVTALEQHTRGE